MKISKNKYMVLALAVAACGGFAACEDQLEVVPLEYKEDPNFAPPHINASWNLEEIASDMVGTGAYGYKDKLYNDLFTRENGWNGGDGVLTVGLPGGHVLWTFNDSFYGVLSDPETRTRGNCSFPRNSIMVQKAEKGHVATEDDLVWMADWINPQDPAAAGWKARTHVKHPLATDFNGDGIAQDYLYWSGDGAIIGNKLQMIWLGVDNRNGNMVGINAALAIYSLEGEPGDPNYMKMESIDHNWIPDNKFGYGSTLWECEDGHLYLYSSTAPGQFSNVPIVARTKGADLTTGLEYYVPNDEGEMIWQEEYPSELQAKNSGIAPDQGALTLPWVFKKGDYYYMLAQTYPFGHELNILRSENPWGPFTDKKVLLKFPNPLDELQLGKYQNLYMLNYHPSLARDGEIVISTNTDCKSFWDNFNSPGSADWYRPFFYRIFKWERVFED